MNKLLASIPLAIYLIGTLIPNQSDAQVFVYRGMIEDTAPVNGRAYKEVQVADLNKDGCPDLYLEQKQSLVDDQVVEGDNIDRVLMNTCNGDIGDPTSLLQLRAQPPAFNNVQTVRGYDVEIADMDGDGHLDIVRPDDSRRIDIFWGNGSGSFPQVSRVLSIANDPNNLGRYDNVAIFDLDNDGDLDVVAAQYNFDSSNGTENVILRNRMNRGQARLFDIESGELPANSTHTVSAARFNGDKLGEVVAGNIGNTSKLYRNDGASPGGQIQFTQIATLNQPALASNVLTTAAEFFDINRDRKMDIYIGKFARASQLPGSLTQHAAYFGNGQGGFSSIKNLPRGAGIPAIYDVRFADVDNDGHIEILRVNALSGAEVPTLQAVRIQRGTTIATDVSQAFFNGEWFGELAIEVADLDRDGDLDLITGGTTESDAAGNSVDNGHSAIHIYENTTITPVQLVATYVPRLGQPRTSFVSTSDEPDQFDFAYDGNLGKFTEQPGGLCQTGSENPTYLKVKLGGAILNQGGIDSCTFIASWDAGPQPIQCSTAIVNLLNAGDDFIINTDDYLTNTANCDEFQPLQPHVRFNEAHWLRATFTVDGIDHVRRVKFRQRTQQLRISANADTYVSQSQPTSNFGGLNLIEVRSTSTGGGAFGFWRFTVPSFNGVLHSARVQLKPLNNISHLNLHQVCGNGWNEFSMTWNNWGTQTGGSCGVLDTLTNMTSARPARFNVDAFINSAGTYTVGGETFDTLSFRRFGSRSAGVVSNRPVLKVTLQR